MDDDEQDDPEEDDQEGEVCRLFRERGGREYCLRVPQGYCKCAGDRAECDHPEPDEKDHPDE